MTISKWQYSGDVNRADYGGTDMRQIGPRLFQFIELLNMDEACGRDNEGQPRYVVELSHVDLAALAPDTIKRAIESCGYTDMPANTDALTRDMADAEACKSYGAAAPLGSWSGNNWHKLLREARREALTLARDAAALADRMERPVNALGSTAAEYMRGDLESATARGVQAGDPRAMIVAKMRDACTIMCPTCHGSGVPCDTCKGRGKVVQTLGGYVPAP
jgi:hypothetical protein